MGCDQIQKFKIKECCPPVTLVSGQRNVFPAFKIPFKKGTLFRLNGKHSTTQRICLLYSNWESIILKLDMTNKHYSKDFIAPSYHWQCCSIYSTSAKERNCSFKDKGSSLFSQ